MAKLATTRNECYRARWVLPSEGPAIPWGYVVVTAGRIAAITPRFPGPYEDLGEVALAPAFVNAHTHLELSDIAVPFAAIPHEGFVGWLKRVIAFRERRGTDPTAELSATRQGAWQSLTSGTALLGDISMSVNEARGTAEDTSENGARPEVVPCLELMGLAPDRTLSALRTAARSLASYSLDTAAVGGRDRPLRRGLSPHAPYTAGLPLVRGAVDLAISHGGLVAMHLAETDEELEFLRDLRGPFQELLESRGVWPTAAREVIGKAPLEYLQALANAPRGLVIHGNALDDEAWDYLAARRDRLTLVHCPRTHAHFGRPPFPLAALLRRHVALAIGTDSRASNVDLGMHGELQRLAQAHPGIPPRRLWQLVTEDGARALGSADLFGSLRIGAPAHFVAIHSPDFDATEPWEASLSRGSTVRGVWFGGEPVIHGTSATPSPLEDV